jgi:hypothetical protein
MISRRNILPAPLLHANPALSACAHPGLAAAALSLTEPSTIVPPPLPRTNRTNLVPPLVLSGHAHRAIDDRARQALQLFKLTETHLGKTVAAARPARARPAPRPAGRPAAAGGDVTRRDGRVSPLT